MQLVINSYGSYLQKNGDCFKIKKGEETFEVSAKKVSSIMITTAAYITTDAIKLAMDHNVVDEIFRVILMWYCPKKSSWPNRC